MTQLAETTTVCPVCGQHRPVTDETPHWTETTLTAGAVNDLDHQWRRVAHQYRDGDQMLWRWYGALAEERREEYALPRGGIGIKIHDGPERKLFRSMTERPAKGAPPRVSTVIARTTDGVLRLFARRHPRVWV